MRKLKLLVGLGMATLAGLLLIQSVSAADTISSDPSQGGAVTVAANESHHNLYVAGATVTVNANTTGDLVVAGGTVTLTGSVEQELMVAGGNISVNGNVGNTVRVAGGTINLNAPIGGDLLVFGGTVNVSDKASVAGDVIISGGTVMLNGPVSGSVRVSGGTVTLNSKINGAVNIHATNGLTFGPNADIAAAVNYRGPREAIRQDGAKVSTVNFEQASGRARGRALRGLLTVAFIIRLLAWIALGLILLYGFRRRTQDVVARMYAQPWKSLGIGVIAAIVVPIVSLILLLVLVGYYIAFVAMLVYLLFLALSGIAAAFFVGAWVIKLLNQKSHLAVDWQGLVIGVVVLGIIMLIPVLGWLVMLILCITAFGALLQHERGIFRGEHQSQETLL